MIKPPVSTPDSMGPINTRRLVVERPEQAFFQKLNYDTLLLVAREVEKISRRDLKSLSSVNNHIRQLVVPACFRGIAVHADTQDRMIHVLKNILHPRIGCIGSAITSFELNLGEPFVINPAKPDSQPRRISSSVPVPYRQLQSLLHGIARMWRLRSLSIFMSPENAIRLQHVFNAEDFSMPSIETLQITSALHFLIPCCPNTQTLANSSKYEPPDADYSAFLQAASQAQELRHLEFFANSNSWCLEHLTEDLKAKHISTIALGRATFQDPSFWSTIGLWPSERLRFWSASTSDPRDKASSILPQLRSIGTLKSLVISKSTVLELGYYLRDHEASRTYELESWDGSLGGGMGKMLVQGFLQAVPQLDNIWVGDYSCYRREHETKTLKKQ